MAAPQKPAQRVEMTRTDIEHTRAAITRIEAKRDAQRDAACRHCYELCLIGWEVHLKRIGEQGRVERRTNERPQPKPGGGARRHRALKVRLSLYP